MAKKKPASIIRRTGSKLAAREKSLVIRSAESSRMTGLRALPVGKRQAAVDALLRTVR